MLYGASLYKPPYLKMLLAKKIILFSYILNKGMYSYPSCEISNFAVKNASIDTIVSLVLQKTKIKGVCFFLLIV